MWDGKLPQIPGITEKRDIKFEQSLIKEVKNPGLRKSPARSVGKMPNGNIFTSRYPSKQELVESMKQASESCTSDKISTQLSDLLTALNQDKKTKVRAEKRVLKYNSGESSNSISDSSDEVQVSSNWKKIKGAAKAISKVK